VTRASGPCARSELEKIACFDDFRTSHGPEDRVTSSVFYGAAASPFHSPVEVIVIPGLNAILATRAAMPEHAPLLRESTKI
jgi:hypothetical protein